MKEKLLKLDWLSDLNSLSFIIIHKSCFTIHHSYLPSTLPLFLLLLLLLSETEARFGKRLVEYTHRRANLVLCV